MAILILVLLLIVWAVVLGPGVVRRRAESHATDSIHAFHQQLGVLQRAGRALIPPANRLRAPFASLAMSSGAPSGRPSLLLVRPGDVGEGSGAGSMVGVAMRRQPIGPGHRSLRAQARKRRRDVLLGLVVSAVGTAVLGALPPLRPLLVVAVLCAMLLAGYVVLLRRLQAVEAERRNKLRRLPVPGAVTSSGGSIGGAWTHAPGGGEELRQVAAR